MYDRRKGGECLIRILAITNQNEIIDDASIDDVFRSKYKWMWIDFHQPNEQEIKLLSNPLAFHPLAIEDCIYDSLQRPKLDYYDDYLFLITHSLTGENHQKQEVNFFLSNEFIVTYHNNESKEINTIFAECAQQNSVENWNPYFVFYRVLDQIVDEYFPVVYALEDIIGTIEEQSRKQSMDTLLDELFEIRHELLVVRNSINPMKELLYRILNSHRLLGIQERSKYFSDIYDHLLTLVEIIDNNREITVDLRESYLSYNSHQTNRIMQILTLITTIFMPLTLIAGIYGMNFEYMPELTFQYGYFIILGMMLFIGITMFVLFKKKGWFK